MPVVSLHLFIINIGLECCERFIITPIFVLILISEKVVQELAYRLTGLLHWKVVLESGSDSYQLHLWA